MPRDDGLRTTLNADENRFIVVRPSTALGSDGWEVVNAWNQDVMRTFTTKDDAVTYARERADSRSFDYALVVEPPAEEDRDAVES